MVQPRGGLVPITTRPDLSPLEPGGRGGVGPPSPRRELKAASVFGLTARPARQLVHAPQVITGVIAFGWTLTVSNPVGSGFHPTGPEVRGEAHR